MEKASFSWRHHCVSLKDVQNKNKKTEKEATPSSEEDSCIEWSDQTVRTAVIDLLKDHSQSALAKISPLSQSVISNIANWKYVNKLSLEKCKEFGEWFCHYREKNKKFTNPTKDCRLTFHHEQELPLLRKWFRLYKNPSVEKFLEFANRLNEGQVRQERPKVTVGKLRIWWKNEKQRTRKQIKEKSEHSKDSHLAATSSALCGSDITLSAHSSNDPSGPNFVELRSPSKNIEPHFICSPTSDLCQELSVDTIPQTDSLKSQDTSSNIHSLL